MAEIVKLFPAVAAPMVDPPHNFEADLLRRKIIALEHEVAELQNVVAIQAVMLCKRLAAGIAEEAKAKRKPSRRKQMA